MRTRLLPIVAVLLVAACQQGASVAISQAGGHPAFAVSRPEATGETCVDDLSIYAGDPDGAPVWHLAAGEGAACTARFRFPDVPQGFAADAGPVPVLAPGTSYTVTASGKGFLAGGSFTATAP